jgi:hypothetical protein
MQCNNWFCDGIFSNAPSLFYQFYIIHAVQYSNVIPSAYILLPDKKEKAVKAKLLSFENPYHFQVPLTFSTVVLLLMEHI